MVQCAWWRTGRWICRISWSVRPATERSSCLICRHRRALSRCSAVRRSSGRGRCPPFTSTLLVRRCCWPPTSSDCWNTMPPTLACHSSPRTRNPSTLSFTTSYFTLSVSDPCSWSEHCSGQLPSPALASHAQAPSPSWLSRAAPWLGRVQGWKVRGWGGLGVTVHRSRIRILRFFFILKI